MSKLTDLLSQNLINERDYPIVKSVAADTWYTGRDLEEDVAALRDQLNKLKIGAGDQILAKRSRPSGVKSGALGDWCGCPSDCCRDPVARTEDGMVIVSLSGSYNLA